MADQLEIAREALAQIGTRSKITSLTDGSAEAQYVNLLYGPIRDFLLTDGDYDFAMVAENLDPAPVGPLPWKFAYHYPDQALRIRQLVPLYLIVHDPHPIEWNIVSFSGERTIYASTEVQYALITERALEPTWDPIFRQSFTRMLGSALAFALENRIEASKVKMDEALGFAGIGKMRDP